MSYSKYSKEALMTPQQFLDSGAFFSPKIYESEVEKGDLVWCRKLACLADSSKLSDNVLNFLKLKKQVFM